MAKPGSPELEAKYGAAVDALNLSGDGQVERSSLLELLHNQDRRVRRVLLASGALIVLLALAVAGMAWTTAALTQKVSTETTVEHGALVSKSDGSTLRTSPGLVPVTAVGKNANQQKIIRLPDNTVATYAGELSHADVKRGCGLVLEGHKAFTTFLPL